MGRSGTPPPISKQASGSKPLGWCASQLRAHLRGYSHASIEMPLVPQGYDSSEGIGQRDLR
jgi:hypothetical protein